MKNNVVKMLTGITAAAMLMAGAAFAAEQDSAVQQEAQTEQQETQAAQVETEGADAFQEGSALLSDYRYEKGTLDEKGWENAYLNLKYVPAQGVKTGVSQNDEVNKYHLRNGEDKQVAVNELIALSDDKSGAYLQMMVEVNPNKEPAEDILERFIEEEGIELASEAKEVSLAGYKFLATTGAVKKDRYFLAISTDMENLAIALKVKYADVKVRNNLLSGLSQLVKEEEVTEAAAEAVTEAAEEEVTEAAGDAMPEEFKEAEEITEKETEPVSEEVISE